MTTTLYTLNPKTANTAPFLLMVQLASVGNPDFGQHPDRPLPGVKNQKVLVRSLGEAVTVCRNFIDENELGGGNWSGGQVSLVNGTPLAYISFNGRIWEPRIENQTNYASFPALNVFYQSSKKLLWVISGQYKLCFTQTVSRQELEGLSNVDLLAPYSCRVTRQEQTGDLLFTLMDSDRTPLATVTITVRR